MRASIFISIAALVGCSGGGGSADDGELGGHCYPNGTCNVGLSCVAGICTVLDGGLARDAPGGTGDAPGDATPADTGFACADDSALEPNGTIQTAWVTPVEGSSTSLSLTGLAICPANDIDIYGVTIETNTRNLEVVMTYDAGAVLQLAVLNAGGTTLANGTANGPLTVRALLANLPIGTYYVRVQSNAGAAQNNYRLQFTTSS